MELSALHSCLSIHPCKQSYREVGAAMSDKQTVIQSSSSFTWPRAHPPPLLMISPVWNLILCMHAAHCPSEEVCRLILHMWLAQQRAPFIIALTTHHSLPLSSREQQRTNLCLSLLLLLLLCSAIIITCFRVGSLLPGHMNTSWSKYSSPSTPSKPVSTYALHYLRLATMRVMRTRRGHTCDESHSTVVVVEDNGKEWNWWARVLPRFHFRGIQSDVKDVLVSPG